MSDDDNKSRPQRKHRRVPAREVAAIIQRGDETVSYTVVNLSIGGALITGYPALPQDELLDLELKLKGVKAVSVRGQVVHLRDQGMGVAFESLASEDSAAMEKLIAAVEAAAPQPPPLPPGRTRSSDDLPPAAAREENLFDLHDPRPPRSGAHDEREAYLRALVKSRDEAMRKGRVALAALTVEADSLRAAATRFKSRLEAANGQQALLEVSLTAARADVEKARDAHLAERSTASDLLEQEQRRTLEAIGAVSALEAKLRRQEVESSRALEEAQAVRKEAESLAADASSVRRAREELMQANRKAMEAQASLKRERDARALAEKSLASVTDEATALKAEVSKLKAKLVAAENALERAASRKAPAPAQPRPAK